MSFIFNCFRPNLTETLGEQDLPLISDRIAIMEGTPGVVTDSGTDPNMTNLLIESIRRGDLEEVRRVASLRNLNASTNTSTPLIEGIRSGNQEMVELLVSLGADVERGDPAYNEPPAFHAIAKNHAGILKYLLSKVADPNKLVNGSTMLHCAVRRKRTACVEILANDDRVDVNAPGKNDGTALHIAVSSNRYVEALILANHPRINFDVRDKNRRLACEMDCGGDREAKSVAEIWAKKKTGLSDEQLMEEWKKRHPDAPEINVNIVRRSVHMIVSTNSAVAIADHEKDHVPEETRVSDLTVRDGDRPIRGDVGQIRDSDNSDSLEPWWITDLSQAPVPRKCLFPAFRPATLPISNGEAVGENWWDLRL